VLSQTSVKDNDVNVLSLYVQVVALSPSILNFCLGSADKPNEGSM
jgi:hypothetical protein